MPLVNTDDILIDPGAITFIEKREEENGIYLSKFEIVEYFFEWLKKQPRPYQVDFIREALSDE